MVEVEKGGKVPSAHVEQSDRTVRGWGKKPTSNDVYKGHQTEPKSGKGKRRRKSKKGLEIVGVTGSRAGLKKKKEREKRRPKCDSRHPRT